jgi:hypothetical protein
LLGLRQHRGGLTPDASDETRNQTIGLLYQCIQQMLWLKTDVIAVQSLALRFGDCGARFFREWSFHAGFDITTIDLHARLRAGAA